MVLPCGVEGGRAPFHKIDILSLQSLKINTYKMDIAPQEDIAQQQEERVQEVPQLPPNENTFEIEINFVPEPVPTDQWGVEDQRAPTALVQSLCSSLKNLRHGGPSLLFPIKKINNISVEVSITKENRSIFTFHIAPTDFSVKEDTLYETVYDRIGDPATREFNENEYHQYIIENVLASLKNVKIDKLNGIFSTTRPSTKFQKINKMWTDFCQEFKAYEHMVLSINECCVCFTATKTTTNCGHTVCLECISKLRSEPITNVVVMRSGNLISCPMCRQQIISL